MRRLLLFSFILLVPLVRAQPSGKIDALYSYSTAFSSIAGSGLSWLRSDGTYVVIVSVGRFSGMVPPVTYRSGQTGTYTLVVDPANPARRKLAFDNNPPLTLDFVTQRVVDPPSTQHTFQLDERIASDAVANTSSRARVDGDHPAIAGFVVVGTKSRWMLIRAIGPALASFGVADPLAAPRLTIYRGALRIGDDRTSWTAIPELAAGLEAIFNLAGAFALPRGSNDCAVLMQLPPGAYTAQTFPALSGGSGTTLTEVYLLPF